MTPAVLVACVGNIFKSDDGFGVEVAARLAQDPPPDGVRVVDFGIRSVHLVYELLAGYDVLVLVDTVSQQDGPPGSLYVLEPDLPPRDLSGEVPEVVMDAHDLSPGSVMTLIPVLGGHVDRILVVGCSRRRWRTGSVSHRRSQPRSSPRRAWCTRSYSASSHGCRYRRISPYLRMRST